MLFTINIGKADEGESNVVLTFKRATSLNAIAQIIRAIDSVQENDRKFRSEK